MGPGGLGNAATGLPGGGGGGGSGGMGDFMLVLQQVAPAGTLVKKGDQVAEFDRQYMLLRLDDYKATVVQSEASLKKRKAQLEISHKAHEQLVSAAKAQLEKARLDLKTIPVLSALDAERARLAFQQAETKYNQLLKEVPFVLASEEAQTRVSELDLEQTKLEYKRAEMNAGKMIAKAPIDGLVVMQSTFRGAEFGQIQQGDQLFRGQFYMQIVDPRSMVINATVNQVDVDHLRLGQKARVRFDAYPDLVLPAHIESIAAVTKPGGFRAQYVKEVPVRLKIDQMDKRVIPDLSVSAEIILESGSKSETVAPLAGIFHDGGDAAASGVEAAKAYVFVQDFSGWSRREVEVGLQNNMIAAVKQGVKPGDVIALDPPVQAPEGKQQVSP